MPLSTDHRSQTATRTDVATIAISLELSRSTWPVTALLPGSEKMSQYKVKGGDAAALMALIERLKAKVVTSGAADVRVVAIQEAGLDGFWIHRLLQATGVENHVVDAASIAAPRRRRRAIGDTDAIIDACCRAWRKLIAEPGRIQSLAAYPWITQIAS
jgi:transposase